MDIPWGFVLLIAVCVGALIVLFRNFVHNAMKRSRAKTYRYKVFFAADPDTPHKGSEGDLWYNPTRNEWRVWRKEQWRPLSEDVEE